MKGKWQRFGFFSLAVAALIVVMMLGTREASLSTTEVFARVAFIGFISYLLTCAVWPRRRSQAHVSIPPATLTDETAAPEPPVAKPQPDQRPVAIIQPRPAGSRPASRVHIPETPTVRSPRGRRLDERSSEREFNWPARQ